MDKWSRLKTLVILSHFNGDSGRGDKWLQTKTAAVLHILIKGVGNIQTENLSCIDQLERASATVKLEFQLVFATVEVVVAIFSYCFFFKMSFVFIAHCGLMDRKQKFT